LRDLVFLEEIERRLIKKSIVYAVITVKTEGYVPGGEKSKMIVSGEAPVWGTIGGGQNEYDIIHHCNNLLKRKADKGELKEFDLSNHHESGMICSGKKSVIFIPFQTKNIEMISAAIRQVKNGGKVWFSFTEEGIKEISEMTNSEGLSRKNNKWDYIECIGYYDFLYIIGGGHVSRALSEIVQHLDFYITVFDDRNNVPTMMENRFCHKKHVIHYGEILKYIPKNKKNYITIMTFGHKSDQLVLEQLADFEFHYLGMMASLPKRDEIYRNLIKKGIKTDYLNRISSPIGVPINSQTPREIAVSIAAELIKVKNTQKE